MISEGRNLKVEFHSSPTKKATIANSNTNTNTIRLQLRNLNYLFYYLINLLFFSFIFPENTKK